jgi:hypothetical protein
MFYFFSESLASAYKTTRRKNPKQQHGHHHCRANLKCSTEWVLRKSFRGECIVFIGFKIGIGGRSSEDDISPSSFIKDWEHPD